MLQGCVKLLILIDKCERTMYKRNANTYNSVKLFRESEMARDKAMDSWRCWRCWPRAT